MAVLTINWETMDKIPPLETAAPVVTGEGMPAPVAATDEAPKTQLTADKPYLIYVSDPAATSSFDTVEKVILDDDRVKLGSKAFHMVKMTPDVAKADPTLTEKGGKASPRFIFVTADLKSVKPLEGNALKLGEVWGAMKAVSDKFYKANLDAMVGDLRNVLNEFDKVNKERAIQDDKEKRLGDKATPADKAAIAAKRAELDARQTKAEASRDKLLELKPKDAKAA
jgi:hypothetical protein